MKTKNCFATISAVMVLGYALWLTGCGGGGSGSGGNNPPPTPLISVSGPASVMVGQQAQYTAKENGAPISATWSVNGVTNGNSTVGTISAAGLYTAPEAVPSPASVTVTAASTGANPGSISVTISPPANPVINSFTANPGTIQSGGSSTLSWTTTNATSLSVDQGVGNVSPVNQGSVVVSPTQTTTYILAATGAPATTPATATATVTVTPAGSGITITSVTPASLYIETLGTLQEFTVAGSGFAPGDIYSVNPCFGDSTLGAGTQSDHFSSILGFDAGTCYSPGWFTNQVKSPDESQLSNVVNFAMYGVPGTLALDSSTGEYYYLERSFVRKFTSDLSPDGSFQPGANFSIAVDNETHKVVMTQSFYGGTSGLSTFDVYSPDGSDVGAGNNSPAMEVEALNHVACAGQWQNNAIECLPDLTQQFPTSITSNAGIVGNQPWLLRMFDMTAVLDAVTYNRGDAQVCNYGIPSFSQNGCVTLPGFTKSGDISLGDMINAGWEMVAFRSGPLADTVAVFSRYDHLLAFVNVASMTLIGQPVALSGNPFTVAADETHGTAIIGFADGTAMLNRFSAVDPVAGTVTLLDATWTNLATGLAVSPDGTNLYLLNRDQRQVTPNQ